MNNLRMAYYSSTYTFIERYWVERVYSFPLLNHFCAFRIIPLLSYFLYSYNRKFELWAGPRSALRFCWIRFDFGSLILPLFYFDCSQIKYWRLLKVKHTSEYLKEWYKGSVSVRYYQEEQAVLNLDICTYHS